MQFGTPEFSKADTTNNRGQSRCRGFKQHSDFEAQATHKRW